MDEGRNGSREGANGAHAPTSNSPAASTPPPAESSSGVPSPLAVIRGLQRKIAGLETELGQVRVEWIRTLDQRDRLAAELAALKARSDA